MERGDKVTFYTHSMVTNGPDGKPVHTCDDSLAFVINEYEDGGADLVIFPPGGPTQFARVWPYDPNDPYLSVGETYYRGAGDAPPEFDERFRYANEPELAKIMGEQKKEYDAAPLEKKQELIDKHKARQAEIIAKLRERDEARAPKADKPEPPKQKAGVEPAGPTENGGRRA